MRISIMQQEGFENFGNLSWWCVFAYDFEGAIWAGREYIKNKGSDVGYISNLGLGYLWNGDLDLAKGEVYLKYKEEGNEIFYTDIKAVLKAGIQPKNCQDVIDIIKLLEVEVSDDDKQNIQNWMPDCKIKW